MCVEFESSEEGSRSEEGIEKSGGWRVFRGKMEFFQVELGVRGNDGVSTEKPFHLRARLCLHDEGGVSAGPKVKVGHSLTSQQLEVKYSHIQVVKIG